MTSVDGEILNEVEQIIGTLAYGQREAVLAAIAEDAEGVLDLARRVAGDGRVNNPPAVFCAGISRGAYRRRKEAAASRDKRTTPADAFQRLFTIKVADLREHTDLAEHAITEQALDYAVGYVDRCQIKAYAAGESPLTLEADMRRSLGQARRDTDAENRKRIGREWTRIVYCLHNPHLKAVYHALRDSCRDPANPSDDEAARTREALIAEIDTHSLAPRRAGALPAVGDLVPVGDAIALDELDTIPGEPEPIDVTP